MKKQIKLKKYQGGGGIAPSEITAKKVMPEHIKPFSSWNVGQWGLNDYSKFQGAPEQGISSFNSAFRRARGDGEKKFVWDDKKYNTNLISKKSEKNYWDSEKFLKDYVKSPYYQQKVAPLNSSDSSNVADLMIKPENINAESEENFTTQMEEQTRNISPDAYNKYRNFKYQKNQRDILADFDKPADYFSITEQPKKGNVSGSVTTKVGSKNPVWRKYIEMDPNNPNGDYTAAHELTHDMFSYNQENGKLKDNTDIDFNVNLPFLTGEHRQLDYINDVNEHAARIMSTRKYAFDKYKIGHRDITDKEAEILYRDAKDNKLGDADFINVIIRSPKEMKEYLNNPPVEPHYKESQRYKDFNNGNTEKNDFKGYKDLMDLSEEKFYKKYSFGGDLGKYALNSMEQATLGTLGLDFYKPKFDYDTMGKLDQINQGIGQATNKAKVAALNLVPTVGPMLSAGLGAIQGVGSQVSNQQFKKYGGNMYQSGQEITKKDTVSNQQVDPELLKYLISKEKEYQGITPYVKEGFDWFNSKATEANKWLGETVGYKFQQGGETQVETNDMMPYNQDHLEDVSENLIKFDGPSHDRGGIKTPAGEFDKRETVLKKGVVGNPTPFAFSDNLYISTEVQKQLGLPNRLANKTIADASKIIENKYETDYKDNSLKKSTKERMKQSLYTKLINTNKIEFERNRQMNGVQSKEDMSFDELNGQEQFQSGGEVFTLSNGAQMSKAGAIAYAKENHIHKTHINASEDQLAQYGFNLYNNRVAGEERKRQESMRKPEDDYSDRNKSMNNERISYDRERHDNYANSNDTDKREMRGEFVPPAVQFDYNQLKGITQQQTPKAQFESNSSPYMNPKEITTKQYQDKYQQGMEVKKYQGGEEVLFGDKKPSYEWNNYNTPQEIPSQYMRNYETRSKVPNVQPINGTNKTTNWTNYLDYSKNSPQNFRTELMNGDLSTYHIPEGNTTYNISDYMPKNNIINSTDMSNRAKNINVNKLDVPAWEFKSSKDMGLEEEKPNLWNSMSNLEKVGLGANALSTLGQGLTMLKKDRVPTFYNENNSQVANLMSDRRLNMQPMINEVNNQYNAAANRDNNSRSYNVQRGLNTNLYNQATGQLGDLRMKEQEANNTYKSQYAETLNNLGQQNVQSRTTQEELQARTDAARQNALRGLMANTGENLSNFAFTKDFANKTIQEGTNLLKHISTDFGINAENGQDFIKLITNPKLEFLKIKAESGGYDGPGALQQAMADIDARNELTEQEKKDFKLEVLAMPLKKSATATTTKTK